MVAALLQRALLALLVLPVLGAVDPSSAGDVQDALARLESPEAAARRAAERWLAEHLAPGDLPALAESSAAASAEALRRLERALGGDERHLELVGLLLGDSAPQTSALGEAALARLVAGWLGERGLEPAPALRVLGALAQRGAAEYRLELSSGPLAPRLERVVRWAAAGVGRRAEGESLDVALDPRLEDMVLRSGPVLPDALEGDFLALLFDLTRIQGLEVEGFGLDWLEGRNAWLHVTPASGAGRRRADQLVALWVRAVLEEGDSARRSAAARALAGSGWSAGLAWLERRWVQRGDGAALEGLALAAARGRVVPSLATPRAVQRLLGEVDRALAEKSAVGDRRADRGRFALAALPPLGSDGSDLSALVVAGLDAAEPRGRFVRLAVLAGMGTIPPAARARLRGRLHGPGSFGSVVLELEALRALAASRPALGDEPWGRLARASQVLELASTRGQAGAVSSWMRSAHLGPPESWRDPKALPSAWTAWRRLLVAEAWLACPGEAATATEHLIALAADAVSDPRVERRLRRLAAGPLRDDLARALASDPDEFGPRARLALLAGALPASQHPRALAALVDSGSRNDPGDLLLLGALAAGPVRDGARTALLERVRAALAEQPTREPTQEAWARACERAWSDRIVASLDQEAEAWRAELLGLVREARYAVEGPGGRAGRERGHPLAGQLARRRWPRMASGEATPLVELESPLPPP